MNIEIRTAIPSDCKILSELCRKTFYETWKPVNTEEDLQKYMNEAFELKKLQEDIEANKINTFFIAFIDQVAIGYLKLRRDRTYDEFKKKLGLKDFSPESQDKIALALVKQAGGIELIAAGKIEEAIKKLNRRWSSLPGGVHSRIKMEAALEKYTAYQKQ